MPEENRFIDLINIKDWQKIQDNFSSVTGVSLRTIDAEGRFVTSISGETKLCRSLIRGSALKDKICGKCLPTFLGGKEIVDTNLCWMCEAGLHNFIAPIRLMDNRTLGYVVAGPVILVMRKSKEEYRHLAEELSMGLEKLWDAILEIKVSSFNGIGSLIELIQDVAESTVNLAYQNLSSKKEMMMRPEAAGKLKKLLEALLDVVFEVSKADVGSVMFLDKKKEELTIQASRGLPDEIASRVRVKLGEGVSGIAAKEGTSFLIDDDVKNKSINRIRPYLRRPYLSTSMVLPLKIKDEVMGVMNVGTLQTSPVRFNAENLNLLNRLVDLVTISLHD